MPTTRKIKVDVGFIQHHPIIHNDLQTIFLIIQNDRRIVHVGVIQTQIVDSKFLPAIFACDANLNIEAIILQTQSDLLMVPNQTGIAAIRHIAAKIN